MIKKIMGTFLVSLFTFCGVVAHAQVEQVTTLTVSDPRGMIATIDQYQMAGESRASSVSLLTHMHDGVDPATHTVVAIFDDLDTMEASLEGRAGSAAWATLLRSASGISQATSSVLAMQKRTWGDNAWEEGGYLAAVLVNAANSTDWLNAMDAWNRSNKVRNPGMVRVVKLRGAPANHAVLIAGPDYADVINFMEGVEASDEFKTLQGAAEAQVVTSVYYRVAKVWQP